jgi:hypothetical protein
MALPAPALLWQCGGQLLMKLIDKFQFFGVRKSSAETTLHRLEAHSLENTTPPRLTDDAH